MKFTSHRSIAGTISSANKGASKWGHHGLFAFGAQTLVVVIDPQGLQILQTLDLHLANVVQVEWARENYQHDRTSSYNARLASADGSGRIVIWDVDQGTVLADFSDGNKPIQGLYWLPTQDACRDLIVALHPPYSIVLWNADTGTRLWKKSYTEVIKSLSFDPFDPARVAFLGNDCIVFIDDFSINKTPSENGKKFFISSSGDNTNSESRKGESISKRVSRLLQGESSSKKSDEGVALNECIQLEFHAYTRHQLLLVYSREVLVLDLEINQTVGVVSLDRSNSNIVQVSSLRQCDAFICLHENGILSMRVRKDEAIGVCETDMFRSGDQAVSESQYESRAQSDALRITRSIQVSSFSVCPVSERDLVLLMNDGRVLVYQIRQASSDHSAYRTFDQDKGPPAPLIGLGDILDMGTEKLDLRLMGLVTGLLPAPFVIRMCPPLTVKNINEYRALCAVGGSNGCVQVCDLTSGQVQSELVVQTCPIRGIEWTSLTSFLTWGHPNPGTNNRLVKNEIYHVDILNGEVKRIRTGRDDEAPVEFIKVSYMRQYCAMVFREKPLEIWDLRTYTLLREMPRSFPHVSALAWSPGHSHKKKSTSDSSHDISDSLHVPSTTESWVKEHFVFGDNSSNLYHLSVDGSTLKDGQRLPESAAGRLTTSITWKAELLVFGDTDGNIGVWDIKSGKSKSFSTHRGWIRKVIFAPGKGFFKLLIVFNEGADIWDVKEGQRLSTIKTPRDCSRILDADWAASDKVLLATDTGALRVVSLELKPINSPVVEEYLPAPILNPFVGATPAVSLSLSYLLQNQPWNSQYNLDPPDLVEASPLTQEAQTFLSKRLALIPRKVVEYLANCRFGIAERCLLAAKLLGDESEIDFWTVALYYIHREQSDPSQIETEEQEEASDVFTPVSTGDAKAGNPDVASHRLQIRPLKPCYDLLCDNADYRRRELSRLALHESKRPSLGGEQRARCVWRLSLLGQADTAVQLLLEAEPSHTHYYTDSLRACLVASIRSSGASLSTIKLVATNLIANGKLKEGVELLCLIDKGLDACRYLQTYGQWHTAAWLAKCSLNEEEFAQVIKKDAEHLASSSINRKSAAVLLLLSLRQFVPALEALYSARCFQRATRLLEALQELDLYPKNDQKADSLAEAVYLEFARMMESLGNRIAAEYYCSLAGSKGELLRREIEFLFSDQQTVAVHQ